MGFIRLAVVSVVGAALAFAAPVAASAAPGSPSKPHPTTTTTTASSKNAQAFAKLVIKPSSVGHVSVKTAGGSTFKPAKDGQSLHVGDTVQTDATGQAEIDYADTAYTRLDVNTTFTIKKLTDSQGNRQVEGSLDVGRTYNRTAALTQSQTFQQDGGGATAAVAGTTFVVSCASATSCTFTAVDHITNLTGPGGTRTLNPLGQCDANNGALCGAVTHLTPDELALIEWIQQNVYLDLVEHGIGDGVFQPFAGTVVVNNGQVQSFTPTTSNQSSTPQNPPGPPPPPPPPTIDPSNPVCVIDAPSTSSSCANPGADTSANPSPGINTIDDSSVLFYLNGSDTADPTAANLAFFFDDISTMPTDSLTVSSGPSVTTNHAYAASTQFTYTPPEDVNVSTQFTYHAQETTSTGTSVSPTATVPVTSTNDCPGDDC